MERINLEEFEFNNMVTVFRYMDGDTKNVAEKRAWMIIRCALKLEINRILEGRDKRSCDET